jgi:hypothetical protein
MCFVKVININNQLKYVVYKISSVYIDLTGVERFNLRMLNEFEFRKEYQIKISKGVSSKSKYYSERNKELIKVRECFLSFGAKSFVFQVAIQKFKD